MIGLIIAVGILFLILWMWDSLNPRGNPPQKKSRERFEGEHQSRLIDAQIKSEMMRAENEMMKDPHYRKHKREQEYRDLEMKPERTKREDERLKMHKEHQGFLAKTASLTSQLRLARKEDWDEFLKGYVKNGGEITHKYDYEFETMQKLDTHSPKFWVADRDFVMKPLHGASSVTIIVKPGVKIENIENNGHNNLLFLDGFKTPGGFVSCYRNNSYR